MEIIQVDREVHRQAEEDKAMPEAGRVLQEIHQEEVEVTHLLVNEVKI